MFAGTSPLLAVATLALTLGLCGSLLYQAIEATRSHRAAAEGVVRDYAAFAAGELARRVDAEAVQRLANPMMIAHLTARLADRFGTGRNDRSLSLFAATLRKEMSGCNCDSAIENVFRLLPGEGGVELAGQPRRDSLERWLRATLPEHALAAGGRDRVLMAELGGGAPPASLVPKGPRRTEMSARLLTGSPAGRPVTVVYTVGRGETEGAAEIFGVVLNAPALVDAVARRVVDASPLLPGTLTNGTPGSRLLSIRMTTAAGETAYASGPGGGEMLWADAATTGLLRNLRVRVGIRTESAGMLVIGGLPRSRLPFTLGLFALTLAAVTITALQLRRQQALVRLRSNFIAGVSHELRTPLAQIQLFADLIESEPLSEEQRKRSIRIVGEEARRLAHLVENVLRFSRTAHGGIQVAPTRQRIAPLIRETVAVFAPLARSSHARFKLVLDEEAAAPVDGDALRQMLLNLLDNAVKYGPRGQEIVVSAARERGDLRIRVDDHGPGVPDRDRQRVWEAHHRLDREAERAAGGSGIGLAVVRELVGAHGGSAWIEESPFGGARVVLSLPDAQRPCGAPVTEAAHPGEATKRV